jgi:hypothetical protein
MTLNSRTWIKINISQPSYSTSESGGSSITGWIQDPISCQPFEFARKLIDGIYAQVGEAEMPFSLPDANLTQEFIAWDAASDEALANFERGLE